MNKTYQINGVQKSWNPVCGKSQFAGFLLDGVVGSVDPFVDGELQHPAEKYVGTNEFLTKELEWAESMVGGTLNAELAFRAFATRGPVSLSNLNGGEK